MTPDPTAPLAAASSRPAAPMDRPGTYDRLDLAALAVIALAALVTALPALRGHLAVYMDNPIHLAEIRDLARPESNGWSELGYLGFPLHMLQSPLIYGGLALLTRWGAPLDPIYTALTVIGLAAPALALYHVGRRRLAVPAALAIACTIVLYRGALVGAAASLGGMFGFCLAGAAFILVLDRLGRRERQLKDVLVIGALTGFIGLTHVYITIAVAYLGVIHFLWSLARGPEARRRLPYDVVGLGLGMLTAAAYWLPNVLARPSGKIILDPIARILSRLITTSYGTRDHVRGLARLRMDPIFYLDAIPQLVVLGLAGLGLRQVWREREDAGRYGVLLAGLFMLLMVAESFTGLHFLGPQSGRMIWVVKIGALAAAFSGVVVLGKRLSMGRAALPLAVAGTLVLGLLGGRVVSREGIPPEHPDYARVQELWSWLRDNQRPDWGRVYLQDTFGDLDTKLGQSHVLGSTALRTGVRHFGAFYGSSPYIKEWAHGEGVIFNQLPQDPAYPDETVRRMRMGSATHLVIAQPDFVPPLERDPRFEVKARIGRFVVLALRERYPLWGSVVAGEGHVTVERIAPGHLRLRVQGQPREVFVSEAYHPFWRVEPPAAPLRGDADRMMRLGPFAGAASSVELVYRPPRSPWAVTLLGVSGLAVIAVMILLRRRRVR